MGGIRFMIGCWFVEFFTYHMLSNIKNFNKTLASIPLPPRLHPELHRGIDTRYTIYEHI